MFTVTEMFSDIPHYLLVSGELDLDKSGLITGTMTGKNCAIAASHQDSFLVEEPGPWPDASCLPAGRRRLTPTNHTAGPLAASTITFDNK
jgi:hypothetical protein